MRSKFLAKFGAPGRFLSVAALATGIALGACAEGTGLGLNMVPESQVESMGLEAWKQIRAETPLSTNAQARTLVQKVSTDILKAAGENPAQWEVAVFKSDQVNAFALPGRKIGVYEGMLKVADTPEQLAAVIGHEVGHVMAHHSAQRVNTEMATQMGTQIIGAALGSMTNTSPDMVAAVLGAGAQYGVVLPYSRNQESDADRLGLHYMARAGYNPQAAVELWREMAKAGKSPPAFLSTHPTPDRRIQQLQAELPNAMKAYRRP